MDASDARKGLLFLLANTETEPATNMGPAAKGSTFRLVSARLPIIASNAAIFCSTAVTVRVFSPTICIIIFSIPPLL
jgi:hypothetical protein